jgi:hypothetical protein
VGNSLDAYRIGLDLLVLQVYEVAVVIENQQINKISRFK